jgi:hypothetical protein
MRGLNAKVRAGLVGRRWGIASHLWMNWTFGARVADNQCTLALPVAKSRGYVARSVELAEILLLCEELTTRPQ